MQNRDWEDEVSSQRRRVLQDTAQNAVCPVPRPVELLAALTGSGLLWWWPEAAGNGILASPLLPVLVFVMLS